MFDSWIWVIVVHFVNCFGLLFLLAILWCLLIVLFLLKRWLVVVVICFLAVLVFVLLSRVGV